MATFEEQYRAQYGVDPDDREIYKAEHGRYPQETPSATPTGRNALAPSEATGGVASGSQQRIDNSAARLRNRRAAPQPADPGLGDYAAIAAEAAFQETPREALAGVIGTVQGGEGLKEGDWFEEFLRYNMGEREEFIGRGRETLGEGFVSSVLTETPASAGRSLATIPAALLGGAAAGAVTANPVAGFLGAAGAAGVVGYRAQAAEDSLAYILEVERETGRRLTDDERNVLLTGLAENVARSARAESVGEGIASAIEATLFKKFPGADVFVKAAGKALLKPGGKAILNTLKETGKFVGKFAATELATEAGTGVEQNLALVGTPLEEGYDPELQWTPRGLLKAAEEAIPAAVGTPLLLGAAGKTGAASRALLKNRLDDKRFVKEHGLIDKVAKKDIRALRIRANQAYWAMHQVDPGRAAAAAQRVVDDALNRVRHANVAKETLDEEIADLETETGAPAAEPATAAAAPQEQLPAGETPKQIEFDNPEDRLNATYESADFTTNEDGTFTATMADGTTHTGDEAFFDTNPTFQLSSEKAAAADPINELRNIYEDTGVEFSKDEKGKITATYNEGASTYTGKTEDFVGKDGEPSAFEEASGVAAEQPVVEKPKQAKAEPKPKKTAKEKVKAEKVKATTQKAVKTEKKKAEAQKPAPQKAEPVAEEVPAETPAAKLDTLIVKKEERLKKLKNPKAKKAAQTELDTLRKQRDEAVAPVEEKPAAKKEAKPKKPAAKKPAAKKEAKPKKAAAKKTTEARVTEINKALADTKTTPTERAALQDELLAIQKGATKTTVAEGVNRRTIKKEARKAKKATKASPYAAWTLEDLEAEQDIISTKMNQALKSDNTELYDELDESLAEVYTAIDAKTEASVKAGDTAEGLGFSNEGTEAPSEAAGTFAQEIAELFGLNVIWVDAVGFNAKISGDTIYIDRGMTDMTHEAIMGHETWHWLTRNAPGIADAIRSRLLSNPELAAQGADFAQRKKDYAEKGLERTDEQILDEIIADNFGLLMSQDSFLEELRQRTAGTYAEEYRSFLQRVLDRITDILLGTTVNDEMLKAMRELRGTVTSELAAVVKARGTETTTDLVPAAPADYTMTLGTDEFQQQFPVDVANGRSDAYSLHASQVLTDAPLKPAIAVDGVLSYTSELGASHYEAQQAFMIGYVRDNGAPPTAPVTYGWVTPEGTYMSREDAVPWLRENDPENYKVIRKILRNAGGLKYLDSPAYNASITGQEDSFDPNADFSIRQGNLLTQTPLTPVLIINGEVKLQGKPGDVPQDLLAQLKVKIDEGTIERGKVTYGWATPEKKVATSATQIMNWLRNNDPDVAREIEDAYDPNIFDQYRYTRTIDAAANQMWKEAVDPATGKRFKQILPGSPQEQFSIKKAKRLGLTGPVGDWVASSQGERNIPANDWQKLFVMAKNDPEDMPRHITDTYIRPLMDGMVDQFNSTTGTPMFLTNVDTYAPRQAELLAGRVLGQEFGVGGGQEMEDALNIVRFSDDKTAIKEAHEVLKRGLNDFRLGGLRPWMGNIDDMLAFGGDDRIAAAHAITDGMLKTLRDDSAIMPPSFDKNLVDAITATRMVSEDLSAANLFGLYEEQQRLRALDVIESDPNNLTETEGGVWYRFPQDAFAANGKHVAALSCHTWCTAGMEVAERYNRNGDMFMYIPVGNSRATVMVRMDGPEITEIAGVENNQKLPLGYMKQINHLIETHDLDQGGLKFDIASANSDDVAAVQRMAGDDKINLLHFVQHGVVDVVTLPTGGYRVEGTLDLNLTTDHITVEANKLYQQAMDNIEEIVSGRVEGSGTLPNLRSIANEPDNAALRIWDGTLSLPLLETVTGGLRVNGNGSLAAPKLEDLNSTTLLVTDNAVLHTPALKEINLYSNTEGADISVQAYPKAWTFPATTVVSMSVDLISGVNVTVNGNYTDGASLKGTPFANSRPANTRETYTLPQVTATGEVDEGAPALNTKFSELSNLLDSTAVHESVGQFVNDKFAEDFSVRRKAAGGAQEAARTVERSYESAKVRLERMVEDLKTGNRQRTWGVIKYETLKRLLRWFPTQSLVDAFEHRIPALRDYYNTLRKYSSKRTEPVTDWMTTVNDQLTQNYRKWIGKFNSTANTASLLQVTPWANMSQQDWVPAGMENATTAEKIAAAEEAWKAAGRITDTKGASFEMPNGQTLTFPKGMTLSDAHKVSSQMYNALPEGVQNIYKTAVAKVRKVYANELDAYMAMMLKKTGIDDERARSIWGSVGQKFNFLKGAYWPLARFGDYTLLVTEERPGEADVTLLFQTFDTKSERDAFASKTRAEFVGDDSVTVSTGKKKQVRAGERVPHEFAEKASEALMLQLSEAGIDNVSASSVANIMNELWLEYQPETSALKNAQTRYGVAGFDRDALRAGTEYMTRHGNRFGYLSEGYKLHDQIKEMRDALKLEPGRDTDLETSVIDDIDARLRATENEGVNKIGSALAKLSSIYFMGSPSAFLVQLSQPFTIGFPKLAADFGGAKAAASITRATSLVFQSMFSISDLQNGHLQEHRNVNTVYKALRATVRAADAQDTDPSFAGLPLLSTEEQQKLIDGLTETERKLLALRMALGDGTIDVSQVNEAIETIGGRENVGLTKFALMFMRSGEENSRKLMVLAAYDAATESGLDFFKAYEMARDTTVSVMYDFRKEGKPELMQKNLWRVVTQFQFFRLATVTRTMVIAHKAFLQSEGITAEDKRKARKEMAWMGVSMSAIGGVTGTPMGAILLSVLSEDDEDEWPEDAAIEIDKWLRGRGDNSIRNITADTIMNGAGGLVGVNLAQRIGFADTFFMGNNDPEYLHGGKWADYKLTRSLLGPWYTMVRGMVEGYDKAYNEGEVLDGIIAATPKGIRDVFRTYRTGTQGLRDSQGRVLIAKENVSYYDMLLGSLGVNPSGLDLAARRDRGLKTINTQLANRRRGLLNDLLESIDDGDEQDKTDAIDAIRKFNKNFKGAGVTGSDISSAIKGQANNALGIPGRGLRILDNQYKMLTDDNVFSAKQKK